MAKFNTQAQGTKTVNPAGGSSYKQTSELEFVSILLTSFANDSFYEKAQDKFDRLGSAISSIDPLFAAKAAIFARNEYGMRSITHIAVKKLAPSISGLPWAKDFYKSVVRRPDDMTEIVSLFEDRARKGKGRVTKAGKQKAARKTGKILPAALKKGFAEAFGKFNEYQLAKYRAANKGVKLVDVVNMIHPADKDDVLKKLVTGKLVSTDTWEARLTQAGQKAETEEEKLDLKKEAWTDLIKTRKLGYFALLKNLRNIIQQAPEALPSALEMLVDEKLIKTSLVLPFRFTTAYDEIKKLPEASRETLIALSKATDISLSNVPVFEGRTLVVVDISGSMSGVATIASLFAAILVKVNNADLIHFDNTAHYVHVNPLDSTLSIAGRTRFVAGGTNFASIFPIVKHKYDRIIILSDMQGWIKNSYGHDTPIPSFNEYKKRTGADPLVYSFDLQNYGTMEFPQDKVYCLAGWSDKVFDIMKLLESDKNALINKINAIEF